MCWLVRPEKEFSLTSVSGGLSTPSRDHFALGWCLLQYVFFQVWDAVQYVTVTHQVRFEFPPSETNPPKKMLSTACSKRDKTTRCGRKTSSRWFFTWGMRWSRSLCDFAQFSCVTPTWRFFQNKNLSQRNQNQNFQFGFLMVFGLFEYVFNFQPLLLWVGEVIFHHIAPPGTEPTRRWRCWANTPFRSCLRASKRAPRNRSPGNWSTWTCPWA